MNRSAVFAILVALLLVVATVMFLYRPQNAEIAELQAEQEQLEAQEQDLANRVAELRQVRESAPDHEAALAAASAIVPKEAAMPAMLRQLQLSADEAGVSLNAVSPARPTPVTVEGGETGLANINLTLDISGNYFQMVDFLRRLEDPAISPRGINWNALSLNTDLEEYPVLQGSLQGDAYAILPTGTAAPDEELAGDDAAEGEPGAEEPADGDEPLEGDEPIDDDVEVEQADTEAELAESTEVDQ